MLQIMKVLSKMPEDEKQRRIAEMSFSGRRKREVTKDMETRLQESEDESNASNSPGAEFIKSMRSEVYNSDLASLAPMRDRILCRIHTFNLLLA